jgi:hypothetical protein
MDACCPSIALLANEIAGVAARCPSIAVLDDETAKPSTHAPSPQAPV